MTCSGCAAEHQGASADEGLRPQQGADGSFSLFSRRFGEGFHGPIGALREARAKFVRPAQLERFPAGSQLVVVDVGFGLGTNSAALLEAARARGLSLQIWALELDPEPLRQALAAEPFRRQWQPATLELLKGLLVHGHWEPRPGGADQGPRARLLWGDARQRVGALPPGGCDLVLLDAFSPQRCPELWSLDFLGALAQLLKPEGRLLTYCCAAAVRRSLQRLGLELASIAGPPPAWSYGTAASPKALPCASASALVGPASVLPESVLRPLNAMELEHLATRAAEPYRDPTGRAPAAEILAARQRAQAGSSAGSTSAWRRRWGLEGRADQPA